MTANELKQLQELSEKCKDSRYSNDCIGNMVRGLFPGLVDALAKQQSS